MESESGRLRTQERQVGLMNVELRAGAESRGLRARRQKDTVIEHALSHALTHSVLHSVTMHSVTEHSVTHHSDSRELCALH